MPVASLFLLGFIAYQFIVVRNKKYRVANLVLALLFFDLFANSGKLLTIMTIEITYSDVLWLILFIQAMLIIVRCGITDKRFISFSILLCAILVNMVYEIMFPFSDNFNMRSILVAIRLIMVIAICKNILEPMDEPIRAYLIKKILLIQKIIFAIACIEFVTKNIFHSNLYGQIVDKVFGISINQVTWQVQRGNLIALQGLCKEPSHFAITLLFSGVFDVLAINQLKKGEVLFWICIIILFISGSFSSVLFIFVLLVTHFAFSRNVNKTATIIIASIVCIPIVVILSKSSMFEYYIERFKNTLSILNSKNFNEFSSEGIRFGSISKSIEYFISSPLFGIGLGNNVLTGGTLAFLSAFGILGFCSYLLNVLSKNNLLIATILICTAIFTMDIGLYYSSYFITVLVLFGYDKINNSRRLFTQTDKIY